MTKKIKTIEFIGLPGSGKSFHFDLLQKKLSTMGLQSCSFRDLYSELDHTHKLFKFSISKYMTWYYFVCFILAHKRYSLHVCKRISMLATRNISTKLRITRFFVREGAASFFYTKFHGAKLRIADEGFLHRLLTYGFAIELAETEISSYVDKCPASDLVIILTHEPSEVLKRRDYASEPFCEIFNICSEKSRTQELENINTNFRRLLHILQSKNINIMEISIHTTPELFLKKIENYLIDANSK